MFRVAVSRCALAVYLIEVIGRSSPWERLGVAVAWPSPASSVVLCHSRSQLIMLSVSVGGRGLKGRDVRSPPPLLKGYNAGSESQGQSEDFE